MKKFFLYFSLIFFTTHLFSQKIDYPSHFQFLLKKIGVEFYEPLDAGYRDYRPAKNEYLESHLTIRSRKEKLEIRYFLVPWEDENPNASNPNILTFTTLSNIATNADDAFISATQLSKNKLQENFNADWGMDYFFQPKKIISDKKNGRMISVCKEGQGTVFIFYFFDNENNEALDTRYMAMRFL